MSKNPMAVSRVVAIVQARMGSTRLPGKVLTTIVGKPLLWHIVHRLRRCRSLDAILIATATNPHDDAIEAFCHDEKIEAVHGPEEDVLASYALAAEKARADYIVCASADAPFLDAGFIDHMVKALIAQDGDHVLMEPGAKCAHEGVYAFSRRALDRLVQVAANAPVAHEHVSGYFMRHPDFVRIVYAPTYPSLARDGVRLSVDTSDDVAFLETLHERMQAKAGEASLADLLLLLEREPRLKARNVHVRQKTLGNANGLVLIHCDGGGTLGFGHVKRSLTLARALRDREGLVVMFSLNGEQEAVRVLRQAGFEARLLPQLGRAQALFGLVAERKPDMIVVDAHENLSRDIFTRIASKVHVAAVIDDTLDNRLVASHAYYPPLPQVQRLSWIGAPTVVRTGWEWSLLGFDPSKYLGQPRTTKDHPTLVVSMGGCDPLDLTRLAARALIKITAPFYARFVIGPGFRNAPALAREIEASSPNFQTVQDVSDLGAEFAAADLALVTFGVTAYELGALGVPALYLALTDDHAMSASSFEQAGMGSILGLGRIVRAEDIARAVWRLLGNPEKRRDMRAAGYQTIDGRAGERIAADLASALSKMRSKIGVTA